MTLPSQESADLKDIVRTFIKHLCMSLKILQVKSWGMHLPDNSLNLQIQLWLVQISEISTSINNNMLFFKGSL